MMGQRSRGRAQLFYSFNLDDHVPSDHLLRGIDRFLDLGDLRRHPAPFYSHTGRPLGRLGAADADANRGHGFGTRSERRL